jgi:ATP synthase I chain
MPIPETTFSNSDQFFDRSLERIRKLILAFAVVGLLVCVVFFRWPVAAGFATGAAVSYVNHRWMERAVEGLGERITTSLSRERGGRIVFRAVLRYVFVAVGAYVIFSVSGSGLYGFLGGVCLPIAAVACEVAIELFVSLRRGY